MPKNDLYLGIDISSTSMRAVLVDDSGADVLKTQYSYSTGSAGRLYTSKVIESLYYLFANVTGMMYEKGLKPGDVRAMSFASIGQTTILLDKDRKPVPIDRQGHDLRTFADPIVLVNPEQDLADRITRNGVLGSDRAITVYQAMESMKAEVESIVSLPSYLTYQLTGRLVDSLPNAFMSGMMDLESLARGSIELDRDVLALSGLEGKFDPIIVDNSSSPVYSPVDQMFTRFRFSDMRINPGILDGVSSYPLFSYPDDFLTLKLETTLAARMGSPGFMIDLPGAFTIPLISSNGEAYFVQGRAGNNGANVFDASASAGSIAKESLYRIFATQAAEVPNLFCRPRKFRERDGSCDDFSYLTGLGSKHIVLHPGKEEYLNAMVFGVMCSLRYLSEGIDSGAGQVFMTGKPISRSPYLRDIAARLFPFEIYYDNDGFQSARGAAALASGIGIDRRKYPKIVPIHCPKTQKYYRRWRSVCP